MAWQRDESNTDEVFHDYRDSSGVILAYSHKQGSRYFWSIAEKNTNQFGRCESLAKAKAAAEAAMRKRGWI